MGSAYDPLSRQRSGSSSNRSSRASDQDLSRRVQYRHHLRQLPRQGRQAGQEGCTRPPGPEESDAVLGQLLVLACSGRGPEDEDEGLEGYCYQNSRFGKSSPISTCTRTTGSRPSIRTTSHNHPDSVRQKRGRMRDTASSPSYFKAPDNLYDPSG